MKQILAALGLAAALINPVLADTISGRVVRVADGDTITILTPAKEQIRVRLAGIDAPEHNQAFGQVSKNYLSDAVAGQEVTIEYQHQDRYGRTIGKVLIGGIDANLRQVQAGLAWWYRQYAKEQSAADRRAYEAAEDEARAARKGLWQDAEPVAPWEFRRRGK